MSTTTVVETLQGIVNRVTYHNEATGWSVLRVQPFNDPQQETVTVHQTKVYAGATMEFRGAWTFNKKFGRQFQAAEAIEHKPASTAAIEKYLGSGLIKGVGPKTAKKIVRYFGSGTLDIFERDIGRLTEVPGIAKKKLKMIGSAWQEHCAIRSVMMFLQGHGISTLFAVKIYKAYGDDAIPIVTEDPYRLANDFYGIGFFSADKVALSIGLAKDSQQRITAAIKHVLTASREFGHCYLTEDQIIDQVSTLLDMTLSERIPSLLKEMQQNNQLRIRELKNDQGVIRCYYAKSLFYDEETVATLTKALSTPITIDQQRVGRWISRYCQHQSMRLSDEQIQAVQGIVAQPFSILTGGPGCGKTTTTRTIVKLLAAMGKNILLAAPTGRAAQRMAEVIGQEAKTIHRLLEWKGDAFQRNEESPLKADCLIVDECSMLDISLAASLLKAVPPQCQVLFIGDADQLPSVGAGNVLQDMMNSGSVPCFRLTQVFRQAQASSIIQFAHQINEGKTPAIPSPFKTSDIWKDGTDCLFIDSEEATQEQIRFIHRVKALFDWKNSELESIVSGDDSPFDFRSHEDVANHYEPDIVIPKKFEHVDLEKIHQASTQTEALKNLLKKIHPWSSLHYGLSAVDVVTNLYMTWIPKYQGQEAEIQILTPMTRGSLGTVNLNRVIQEQVNPLNQGAQQIKIGERFFRQGDRVIHRRNNYDLKVYNGDIGKITAIDNQNLTCTVEFSPDNRAVQYEKEHLVELDLAYAITIHKSQGEVGPRFM